MLELMHEWDNFHLKKREVISHYLLWLKTTSSILWALLNRLVWRISRLEICYFPHILPNNKRCSNLTWPMWRKNLMLFFWTVWISSVFLLAAEIECIKNRLGRCKRYQYFSENGERRIDRSLSEKVDSVSTFF